MVRLKTDIDIKIDMRQQIVKPQITSLPLKRYLPQTDRLWFNLDEREMASKCAIDYNAITSRFGLNLGFRAFFAIQQIDELDIRGCLLRLATDPLSREIAARLTSFSSAEGYLIPFTKLSKD